MSTTSTVNTYALFYHDLTDNTVEEFTVGGNMQELRDLMCKKTVEWIESEVGSSNYEDTFTDDKAPEDYDLGDKIIKYIPRYAANPDYVEPTEPTEATETTDDATDGLNSNTDDESETHSDDTTDESEEESDWDESEDESNAKHDYNRVDIYKKYIHRTPGMVWGSHKDIRCEHIGYYKIVGVEDIRDYMFNHNEKVNKQ